MELVYRKMLTRIVEYICSPDETWLADHQVKPKCDRVGWTILSIYDGTWTYAPYNWAYVLINLRMSENRTQKQGP